jgi:hypothetical protein
MKNMKFTQQFRTFVPKIKTWLFVAYIIMAAYLILDGAVYMITPYSGRISTLICRENEQGASECKITIYGFKEIYQRSFLIRNVRYVEKIDDWHGMSERHVCGIVIKTFSDDFRFVDSYQGCGKITKTVEKINDLFDLGDYSPAKRIIYIGFNSSLYRRVFLLVLGLLIALRWGTSWSLVPAQITFQVDNKRAAFRHFTFSWWKTNTLLKVCFYLSNLFFSGLWVWWSPTKQGSFSYAYNFGRDPLNLGANWCGTSFGILLCLYPLMAYAIMQAYIQWKFLREKLHISGWWIAAPMIASLSLVFGLPAALTSQECSALKFLLFGIKLNYGNSAIFWNLVIYLLLVGGIQWLVLRRRLSYSIGWIVIPLINASIVPMYYRVIQNFPYSLLGPFAQRAIIMIFVFFVVGEMITSIYLSWVIYSKNPDDAGR